MTWRKLGRVFNGGGSDPSLASHAALPTAAPLGGDLVRVFYSGRDNENRSAVGTLVLRLGDTPRVEDRTETAVFGPGPAGAFDDSGLSVGSVVPGEGGTPDRLYYMGWNLGRTAPWRNAIGMAEGDIASGRFHKPYEGPVLDRSIRDPFSMSYPWVRRDGDEWRMWYGTFSRWGTDASQMLVGMRQARSADGVLWTPDAERFMDPRGDEVAVNRPCVADRAGGGYEMWFSGRGLGPYAVGHARSADLERWTRDEVSLISPDAEGWEGGEAAYPCVFDAAGRRWMLYNGARFGVTGFGLAVWEP